MSNKTKGLYAALKLIKKRKHFRRFRKAMKSKLYDDRLRADPLEGAPQARGIVLEKVGIEAKQPNSGIRKCVRVQLIKNGKQITVFAPRDKAIQQIDEHDEVIVEGIGGAMGRAKGDIPGVRWAVVQVNGVSLEAILSGKRQKKKR